MIDHQQLAAEVHRRVPAYRAFLAQRGGDIAGPFAELPLTDKQGYLLAHDLAELCWDGSLSDCHLIGASSGFSKTGSLFWPKRPKDEAAYLEGLDGLLTANYAIDKKRTLALVCLAFGTWIGGIQLAAAFRGLAAGGRHPLTVATPGLNLGEAVDIHQRFGDRFDQVIYVSNVSSVNLVSAILAKRGLVPPPGSLYFAVVGEYFPESLRLRLAQRYGHDPEASFPIWTGYGSADTGDLGVETKETIALRRFLHQRPELSEKIFGSGDTPMLLAAADKAHLEIIEGNIVATKDQLIPLVRYDTGDAGLLLTRAELRGIDELPAELSAAQPDLVLAVFGRVSDAVVFYGTNLMVGQISDYLLGLPEERRYGGFFELAQREHDGVEVFHFRIFIQGRPTADLAAAFQADIVRFLKQVSLEFKAKYDSLCAAIGRDLITVELAEAAEKDGAVKHRYLVDR